jgi:formylglycine-generating enzyme required for sulfatase activity
MSHYEITNAQFATFLNATNVRNNSDYYDNFDPDAQIKGVGNVSMPLS